VRGGPGDRGNGGRRGCDRLLRVQHLSGPPPSRLGAGARVAAAALVLGGVVVGAVVCFYGLGAALDALLDRGVVACGDDVACGVGTGFLWLLAMAATVVLAAVAGLLLGLCAPRRWTTGRALAAAGWVVAGHLVLLVAVMVTILLATSSTPS
jgi:hypothetical protein